MDRYMYIYIYILYHYNYIYIYVYRERYIDRELDQPRQVVRLRPHRGPGGGLLRAQRAGHDLVRAEVRALTV